MPTFLLQSSYSRKLKNICQGSLFSHQSEKYWIIYKKLNSSGMVGKRLHPEIIYSELNGLFTFTLFALLLKRAKNQLGMFSSINTLICGGSISLFTLTPVNIKGL